MFLKTATQRLSAFGLCVLGVLCGQSALVRAQFQMPDPKQMSGIPRPVTDLPDGSITVLIVRGSVTNGLPGQTVTLHIGSKTQAATTDDAGRVQFDHLPAGETLKAEATVDGEHLETQEFPAPAQGGIRVLLAATDKSKAAAASAPAVSGQVSFSNQTRFVMEPGDETMAVYYLLALQNNQSAPVNPTTPVAFDLPKGAVGATMLQGSSPLASVKGTKVRVNGPVPPGTTAVQLAFELPSDAATFELEQPLPAALDQFTVIVKKVADTHLTSPLIVQQQDLTQQDEVYIAAVGGTVPAGQPLSLTLTDLPHHSAAPRMLALALAFGIVLVGAWVGTRPPEQGEAVAERRRLADRRDKLMKELVRVERDRANGRIDDARYAARREELVSALELVYGALDESAAPDPATGASAAA